MDMCLHMRACTHLQQRACAACSLLTPPAWVLCHGDRLPGLNGQKEGPWSPLAVHLWAPSCSMHSPELVVSVALLVCPQLSQDHLENPHEDQQINLEEGTLGGDFTQAGCPCALPHPSPQDAFF